MMKNGYPNDSEIKPKWSRFHFVLLILSSILIWGLYIWKSLIDGSILSWQSTISLTGLYIDIIGVLVASLKTPYFGSFHDGGELEFKRERADNRAFQKGMLLIAIGFMYIIHKCLTSKSSIALRGAGRRWLSAFYLGVIRFRRKSKYGFTIS